MFEFEFVNKLLSMGYTENDIAIYTIIALLMIFIFIPMIICVLTDKDTSSKGRK